MRKKEKRLLPKWSEKQGGVEDNNKRVVVAGATGFIGSALCRRLVSEGFSVTALTRNTERAKEKLGDGIQAVKWDSRTSAGLSEHIEGAKAVINLAGESVAGIWTRKKKERILNSRLASTGAIAEAIRNAKVKPKVLIQSSASGYYGWSNGDAVLTEKSPQGNSFLAEVSSAWERQAYQVDDAGVRLVIIRTGLVLGADGGMLGQLVPFFRLYLGVQVGAGKNWMPWIHIDDETGAIMHLIKNDGAKGVYNLASPSPVQSRDFYLNLGRAFRKPVLFRIPAFLPMLVAPQMTRELILSSQRIMPEQLIESGYKFQHTDIRESLEDIFQPD